MEATDRAAFEGARMMISGAARIIDAPSPGTSLTLEQREHLRKARNFLGDALYHFDRAMVDEPAPAPSK